MRPNPLSLSITATNLIVGRLAALYDEFWQYEGLVVYKHCVET